MEATTLPPITSARPLAGEVERAESVPWQVYASVFGATSIVVGVIWDISWHKTIGRDSFWTPAHMAIYLGGLVAGVACGWRVLRTTFRGTAAERASSVRFWRYFYGPLGGWVCIWGTFAMLTSAPFDDWWHNAYGLDVKILSPPHTVLALGMYAIGLGALLLVLALQNRASGGALRAYGRLYLYVGGILVTFASLITAEYAERILMHSAIFYKVAAGVFPFFLVWIASASRARWPVTKVAAGDTGITLAMVWILPLFPAEPKLGPIYQDVTRMVPMNLPLLLIAPAVAMDLLLRAWPDRTEAVRGRRWLLAAALGVAFVAVFAAVQWPFASFLMSPASHNWFFAGDNFFYGLPTTSLTYRMQFRPPAPGAAPLWQGFAWAIALAILSSRLGLALGGWLRRVRR